MRKPILHCGIENALCEVFGIWNSGGSNYESRKERPKWIYEGSICDMSEMNIENGCSRNGSYCGKAAARRRNNLTNRAIAPVSGSFCEFFPNDIYGSLMELFVFDRNIAPSVCCAYTVYCLHYWTGFKTEGTSTDSFKMQWKSTLPSVAVSEDDIPFLITASDMGWNDDVRSR